MEDETPCCFYSINSLRAGEVQVFADQREQTDVTKEQMWDPSISSSQRQNINIQITRCEHVRVFCFFCFQCADEDLDLVPGFEHGGSSQEDWSNAENKSLLYIMYIS